MKKIMDNNFNVEIISPNTTFFKSEAIEVIIPSYEGQMGILQDHISLITFLRPGLIIVKKNNEKISFFIEDGIVEFSDNNLLILSATIKSVNKLDKNFIETAIKDSQEKFNNSEITDKEKYLLSHKIETLNEINR